MPDVSSGREEVATLDCDDGHSCTEGQWAPCPPQGPEMECEMKTDNVAGIVIAVVVGAGCFVVLPASQSVSQGFVCEMTNKRANAHTQVASSSCRQPVSCRKLPLPGCERGPCNMSL